MISDYLGSIKVVVNAATGAVAQTMDYTDLGATSSSTTFQAFGFAGGFVDDDSRFYHFDARDYDGATGVWLTKDPIRFAGGDTNLYGYVLAEPVNGIDPSGLFVLYVGVGGGATVANSPTSPVGHSGSFLSGYGFDFGSLSFFGFHTQGGGKNAYGAVAGVGASIGAFTGSKDQFMGAGSCSTVSAGAGLEGAGASTFNSTTGGNGIQIDFFGPSFGLGGGLQNTMTTPGFWPSVQ